MGWDETSLEQPDHLVPRPSSRLSRFEGKCIECNRELDLDEIAISTYEVQSKPRVLRLHPTGYVLGTYSDTPVEGWIHLYCLFNRMKEYITPNPMDI